MNQQAHRKNEHVSLAEKFFQDDDHQFQAIRLVHNPLPEISMYEVNPDTSIEDNKLKFNWPFYIEAMTGGNNESKKINDQLSRIAERTNLAMACGSQSVALKDESAIDSFKIIRKNLKSQPVIANIGAGHSVDDVKKVIKMINANAIEIHINVIQEMIMPEGDRKFHWINNLKQILTEINIPIIIKEVGFGMDKDTLAKLKQLGFKNINISGRGGTSFAQIENFRRPRKELTDLTELGQTTVESLLEAQQINNDVCIIASGGIKNALDIIKSIALGAKIVGVAGTILNSLITNGEAKTIEMIQDWQNEIITVMTILGCKNIDELRHHPIILSSDLLNYLKQRHLKLNK